MISVITEHLKNYLEVFITEQLQQMKHKVNKMNLIVLNLFKRYSPKHDKYVTLKNNLIDNVSKFYEGREKIIEGFKNEVFSFY